MFATSPQVSQAQVVPLSLLPPALEAPRLIIPLVIEEPPEPTVKELVMDYAIQYGVDVRLALAIAQCESGLDPTAENPSPHSSAGGVFQFLDSTWAKTIELLNWPEDTDKLDAKKNVEAGIFLLKKDGTRHWLESKSCWSKMLNGAGLNP